MIGLLDPQSDLFVPRMARERSPQQLPEFGPVAIGTDRKVDRHQPAAAADVVQQTGPQDLLDRLQSGSRLAECFPLQVAVGGRDPRPRRVVQDDRVELLEIFRQKHRQIVADHGRIRAALLAQGIQRAGPVRDAIPFVRILGHQVGRRVEDQDAARRLGCDRRFFRRSLVDLPRPVRRNLVVAARGLQRRQNGNGNPHDHACPYPIHRSVLLGGVGRLSHSCQPSRYSPASIRWASSRPTTLPPSYPGTRLRPRRAEA
jgi:hypothetical protein